MVIPGTNGPGYLTSEAGMKNGHVIKVVLVIFLSFPIMQSLVCENRMQSGASVTSATAGPNLQIQQTGFLRRYGSYGFEIILYSTVVNTGDEAAVGPIVVEYNITRLSTRKMVANDSFLASSSLAPGDTVFLEMNRVKYLPKFGLFRVSCEVNPGRVVNETDYDNNKVQQLHVAVFDVWF
jgi:hypothetical protein